MEKQTSKREEPKRVLETSLLQMNQNDCFGLIGGIVEKGFSDKPQSNPISCSLPKPTVLPFPVARHRSHGPHWRPMSGERGDDGNDDNDEDDEEYKAFMESDPVAAFANPVRRRRKKELEFRKWKEIILDDSSSRNSKEDTLYPRQTKGKTKDEASKTAEKRTSLSADKSTSASMKVDDKLQSKNSDGGFIDSLTAMEIDNSSQLDLQEKVEDRPGVLRRAEQNKLVSSMAYSSNSSNFRNEQESMTLESQIDAENRSRIEQMSTEEIAEAQAEIMEKVNPTLLKLLQKRGQEKLNKKNQSMSEVNNGCRFVDLQVENSQNAKHSLHTENDFTTTVMTPPLENTENKFDNKTNMTKTSSTTASSSSWNIWSDRVEAVRELRFSLEGDVIKNDIAGVSMSDNVTERDFLRTEGDPAAAGYTIKEAVALSRSVIPAQRALAWHILSSVLERALHNICKDQAGYTGRNENRFDKSVDWEAVWAYALGPEPELILSLRICLDDNHYSVVLACAKVVQCVLSCDVNEKFFDVSEKIATSDKDIYTAPIFRSKSDIDDGFFHGGFWKYSAKPSNLLPFSEDSLDDETEGQHTIQDDIVVAGQDFTAGLVRMGILPRLRYLLETDPTVALEECVISILVAIARHSPSCANAILECHRLIQTIVHRFTVDNVEVRYSMIKFVILFKVLARTDQKNCLEFLKNGYFQIMTWHLYNYPSSVDHWIKLGREKCKLSSALLVEQMRFWKVCIQYGYCVSNFSDLFPALCLWLNPPTFKKLTENNILSEFTSLSREAYLVLESLAIRLPNFFSQQHPSHQLPEDTGDDRELWSWSYVTPMVDLALKWIATRNDPEVTRLFEEQKGRGDSPFEDLSVTPLLWVYAAAFHMLFRVLERVTPEDTVSMHVTGGLVPWLPEFVPKIGLEFVKYWLLGFPVSFGTERRREPDGVEPFIKELIYLRQKNDHEMSLASVFCLNGMIKIINALDSLIQSAKTGICSHQGQEQSLSKEGKLLQDGIINGSMIELRFLLDVFTNLVASRWHSVQSIETFGRGGPAPGVGIGWGAPGGGFWSKDVLLVQTDARFLIHLLETFQNSLIDAPIAEGTTFDVQRFNSALGLCLTAGPKETVVIEKALDFLLHVSVLKYLDLCIRQVFRSRSKTISWQYEGGDYQHFSKMLSSHFRRRWLFVKVKSKPTGNSCTRIKTSQKDNTHLDTIYEESALTNPSDASLMVEWAHQRLPLPTHFYLSPISTITLSKQSAPQKVSDLHNSEDHGDFLEVCKSGLFFVLGVEALSILQGTIPSPVQHVSLTWKLHSLSVNFLVGMEVLEQEQSRETFEALQDLYGELLDKVRFTSREGVISVDKTDLELLRFRSEIHESYSTFIEVLVEQFSAVSYGDLIFGRQVALYLHRCVESCVRLAAWNTLSNSLVLDLLPPLEKCLSGAQGYLQPIEDDEGVLEAYAKSWTSGALDKAAIRGSVAYTLVVHHLSSFIFDVCPKDKLMLRNRLARILLRDYAQNQQHEGMLLNLINSNKPSSSDMVEQQKWMEARFVVLVEACEGNSLLLTKVNKLKAIVVKIEL